MTEAIRASAHAAHTLSRLSIGYKRMAEEFPAHRARHLAYSKELRTKAGWYLAWARRMQEMAR